MSEHDATHDDARPQDATVYDADLRVIATRLGTRAAEHVDVEHTAQAVIERLRAPAVVPLARRVRAGPVWLRLAAGLALLAGGAVVGGTLLRSSPGGTHFVHEDLSDLTVEQLGEVLRTLDVTLNESSASPTDELDQLTEQQLEDLLHSLEG